MMIDEIFKAYDELIKTSTFDYIFKDSMSPLEALCFTIYVDLSMSKTTAIQWIYEITGLEIKPQAFTAYIQRARRKYRENHIS